MIIGDSEFQVASVLGKRVRAYQTTVRLKAGEVPWDYFCVAASHDAFVSISCDGKFYGEDIILRSGSSIEFNTVVKAVRIRVKRSVYRRGYSLELGHRAAMGYSLVSA